MKQAEYVAVDWGTSSFRLWLVDRAGNVLGERRSHEGMVAAGKPGFAAVLQTHLDAVGAALELPVIVCGMAGARQGWVEAGYVDTPAPLAAILKHAAIVPGQDRDIRILPGIAQRDRAAPDGPAGSAGPRSRSRPAQPLPTGACWWTTCARPAPRCGPARATTR